MTAAVDWSAPIEAVHEETGEVVPVKKRGGPDYEGDYAVTPAPDGIHDCFRADGSKWVGAYVRGGTGWRIRNVAKPAATPDIAPALVERMVALVREMAKSEPVNLGRDAVWEAPDYKEARAIAAELPQPVDPDEAEAQKLNDDSPYDLTGLDGERAAQNVRYIGATILAAIKRGRALAAAECGLSGGEVGA